MCLPRFLTGEQMSASSDSISTPYNLHLVDEQPDGEVRPFGLYRVFALLENPLARNRAVGPPTNWESRKSNARARMTRRKQCLRAVERAGLAPRRGILHFKAAIG